MHESAGEATFRETRAGTCRFPPSPPGKGGDKQVSRLVSLVLALVIAATTAAAALADGNNPANPGGATTGYEGHPGNQSHH